VNKNPSLGFSKLSRNEFATGPLDKLRRVAFLLAGMVVLAGVFYFLTRAVETSTAHATGDSGFHSD
jgi:hypothetical protein